MSLLKYCQENNINCTTCNQSYKNYYNERVFHYYCNRSGLQVMDKDVCIYYKNE